MTHVESAEAAGGRLGAVLSASLAPGAAFLPPAGPWVTTSPDQARRVLTDPAAFDFPGHVARDPDLSGSVADTRSGHYVFTPLTGDAVARGMTVFVDEWDRALARAGGSFEAMLLLRRPVARATCAAVLPDVAPARRDEVADLVLAWIDHLGPVIAAPRPPRGWSRKRRREVRARRALEESLEAAAAGTETPQVLATKLAAGIQVPIAAGAWLLVWTAARPCAGARADHVVWETLRLSSPSWITARVAVQDVRLGDADVTAGSLVLVSPLLLGRRHELVPGTDDDRASFDPSRWDTDRVRPGAWLPFGAGPHACPGRTLGLAMLTHLATWSQARRPALLHPVSVDQSRGIFPSPALIGVPPEGPR